MSVLKSRPDHEPVKKVTVTKVLCMILVPSVKKESRTGRDIYLKPEALHAHPCRNTRHQKAVVRSALVTSCVDSQCLSPPLVARPKQEVLLRSLPVQRPPPRVIRAVRRRRRKGWAERPPVPKRRKTPPLTSLSVG